jgi:cytochrome c oxidase subunit 2
MTPDPGYPAPVLGGRALGGRTSGALSPRGSDASTIADLFWFMLIIAGVVFALVLVALVVGLRRRSADTPDDLRRLGSGTPSPASRRWIVGGGVALPAIVIVAVLGATLVAMRDVVATDDDAELTVEVIGHQYWWEVRYPDSGVVTANEVHIPADTPVEITLRSADVIHSFWVPSVAGKMDLLPERTNRIVVEADAGVHQGRCAEFCGTSHANMDVLLVAHDGDGFDQWLAAQSEPAAEPASDAARRGMTLVTEAGCGSCHAIAGTDSTGAPPNVVPVGDGSTVPAPDLTHLASRSSILGGAADPTMPDLIDWITDPHTVKPDVDMPAADLTDAEIADVVAYLMELE